MAIYYWDFPIKTLPEPPSGINQASPPPPPELVGSSSAILVDPDAAGFIPWLRPAGPHVLSIAIAAANNGVLNTRDPFWASLIAQLGPAPVKPSVALAAYATWQQIYSVYSMGGPNSHGVETTLGVTSSEEETRSFAAEVGLSVSAGFGPVDATLTASFSASASSTRTIAFSESRTSTTVFQLPGQAFVQIWQLHITTSAGSQAISDAVEQYQVLCYPPQPEGTPALTEAQVEALRAQIKSKRKQ